MNALPIPLLSFRARWRLMLLVAPLLAAGLLAQPHPAMAQEAGADASLTAQWQVRLEADGQGSDARGAQLLALLGGQEGIATAQDKVSWPSDGNGSYRIDSTLSPRGVLAALLRRLHWVRSASGEVRRGVPELLAASNQRGDDPATRMQIEQGRMLVSSGSQSASPAKPQSAMAPGGLTDPLTLSWGYLQRPLPSQPFTVPLLINNKVQTARVVPKPVSLRWQGQEIACVLLDARSEQSSATLRIWLRQSDGLPLQIALGMGERYGLDVVQTLVNVPEGLALLKKAS